MLKSVRSVPHRGLRDWVWQRLSALVMVLYLLCLGTYLIRQQPLSFGAWHHLFSEMSVKVATIIFLAALMSHAWIGVWTVLTDYIKPLLLRGFLQLIFVLMLVAFFVWGLLILGSV